MRKSRVLLAGAAVAAAAVATSAFTASNTVPDSVAGYGQGDVTGAEVSNIDYVANSADNTILDAVVFTVITELTPSSVATLTLKSGATPADPNTGTDGTVEGTFACTETTPWTGTQLVLTCDTTVDGPVTFSSFNAIGLTVVD